MSTDNIRLQGTSCLSNQNCWELSKTCLGLGYSTLVECLPATHKALDYSISSTRTGQQQHQNLELILIYWYDQFEMGIDF